MMCNIIGPFLPLVRVEALCKDIKLPNGWAHKITLNGAPESTFAEYQVVCTSGTCNVTGEPLSWRGRKWRISKHMTDSEIVQTIFKAVLTALEHETRENFLYKGQAVFDPHYDLDKLVALRKQDDALSVRKEMT